MSGWVNLLRNDYLPAQYTNQHVKEVYHDEIFNCSYFTHLLPFI